MRHAVVDMPTSVERLRAALECRSVAATGMNEQSSRAHTVFQLHLESAPRVKSRAAAVRHSTLTFVDLAGSERLAKSHTSGARACAPPFLAAFIAAEQIRLHAQHPGFPQPLRSRS